MIAIAAVSLGGIAATATATSTPVASTSIPLLRHSRVDCKNNLENGALNSPHRSWVTFVGSTGETSEEQHGLVPLSNSSSSSLQPLSQEVAMGLVLQAASGGGWTTDSGLEGPAFASRSDLDDLSQANQWPQLSKSPRRRMRIAFTCNVCGERTMRAINPHAYTDGTVFVQCKGCDVFHKLVDNLNLFYEWDGRLYKTSSKTLLPTDGEQYIGIHREIQQSDDDDN